MGKEQTDTLVCITKDNKNTDFFKGSFKQFYDICDITYNLARKTLSEVLPVFKIKNNHSRFLTVLRLFFKQMSFNPVSISHHLALVIEVPSRRMKT